MSFGTKNAPTIRQWLQSYCTITLTDARGPVQIPSGHPHLAGTHVPHTSHSLYYYRGITYCDKCGSYGSQKMSSILQGQCEGICTIQTVAQRGRLRACKPSQGKGEFPTHEHTTFTVHSEILEPFAQLSMPE